MTQKIQFDFLNTLHQKLKSDWDTERINYYILQRNNNLTTNQTKMINSILNRKLRTIKLEKLKFTDERNEIIFTNNPDVIERECIKL